jgi:hypothetical protein
MKGPRWRGSRDWTTRLRVAAYRAARRLSGFGIRGAAIAVGSILLLILLLWSW